MAGEREVGFKAGLEVHQQLDTGKLFSRTPSTMREDKPEITIKRKLRASASEMGEFDPAALEAVKKDYSYEYEAYPGTISLVELDEEPPQKIDKEALKACLTIAQMCSSKTPDTMFVMRKIVVDGSNTSGFQRTTLAGMGGHLKVNGKNIEIQSIVLEEDSARPMEKNEKEKLIVYRIDRLGIPLIELSTEPDIESPKELQTTAKKIGELFRRTCKAKRGLGSIRQDVNISIKGGARVEIKGVQELEMIETIAEREIQRQQALLEIKAELEKRKAGKQEIPRKPKNVSQIFSSTGCNFLKGKTVFGIKAGGFAGILGKEIQKGRRLGKEIAGYVKAKTGLQGIIHSDELPAYSISEEEKQKTAKELECTKADAFVLVSGEEEKCISALEAVKKRLEQCFNGVPEETRNALEDGNTEYSRPLPGAARMYPETDHRPINIEKKTLAEIRKKIPLTTEEREKLYKKHSLSEKLANEMKLSNYAIAFESLLKKGINATTAAVLLIEGTTQLKREGIQEISSREIEEVLLAEKNRQITKDIMLDLLRKTKKQNIPLQQAIKELSVERVGEKEITETIRKIIEANSALVKEKGEKAISALMGNAMKELRGKADGKTIMEILKTEIARKKQ